MATLSVVVTQIQNHVFLVLAHTHYYTEYEYTQIPSASHDKKESKREKGRGFCRSVLTFLSSLIIYTLSLSHIHMLS